MELNVLSLWAENLVPGNIIHLRMGDFVPADVKSLMFVMLVFMGQANVYLVRERHHVWNSVPSRWILLGTLVDVLLVSLLASQGILIPAIPFSLIGMTLAVVGLYLLLVDRLKMMVFRLARF